MDNRNYKKPLISIITVCFNSAKTIRQTIESVLNQTYSNIEYILIDGKSTDNTVAIIQEYAPLFAGKGIAYRWVSEPDNGIYDAMNKGIKLATGEWIGIINSDDWYELDACKIINESVQQYPNAKVFCGDINHIVEIEGYSYLQVLKSKINLLEYNNIAHPSVFISRQLYKSKLYDLTFKIVADWDYLLFCYKSHIPIQYINEVIANFRWGGLSSRYNLEHLMERYAVRKRYNISSFPRFIHELFTSFLRYKIKSILGIRFPINKTAFIKRKIHD